MLVIIQLCNYFQKELEVFPNVRTLDEGMKKIATYMNRNDLKECIAYHLVKGEITGKGWRIWRTLDSFFYRVNNSFRKPIKIGNRGEFQ